MNEYEKLLLAVRFATKAHEGQRRKYVDEPYIMHPLRVAQRVAAIPSNYASVDIITALLHDTLEDCPDISPKAIGEEFGAQVLYGVHFLTDLKTRKGGPNRKTRKADSITRLHYAFNWIQNIKCADMLDNLPSIVTHDKNFAKVYVNECFALANVLDKADETIRDELFGVLEWAKKEIANEKHA